MFEITYLFGFVGCYGMDYKYSKKLVYDYVNGNDIDGYTLDELEDDYLFMIEVMKYSKDKKMYEMCSDNVKKNAEFVKFIIDYFKGDKSFVLRVSDYYLLNSNNEVLKNEILILLSRISKDDEFSKYNVKAYAFYNLEMTELEILINELKHEIDSSCLGLGFTLILE